MVQKCAPPRRHGVSHRSIARPLDVLDPLPYAMALALFARTGDCGMGVHPD